MRRTPVVTRILWLVAVWRRGDKGVIHFGNWFEIFVLVPLHHFDPRRVGSILREDDFSCARFRACGRWVAFSSAFFLRFQCRSWRGSRKRRDLGSDRVFRGSMNCERRGILLKK